MEIFIEEVRELRIAMSGLSKSLAGSTSTLSGLTSSLVDSPGTMSSEMSDDFGGYLTPVGIFFSVWLLGVVVAAQFVILWRHNVPPSLVSYDLDYLFNLFMITFSEAFCTS